MIRKRIRQHIRDFEEQQIKDILEEKWSTRMTRKAIYRNKMFMTKIKDKRRTLIHNRKEIVKVATHFHKNLYTKNKNNATQYHREDWETIANNSFVRALAVYCKHTVFCFLRL